MIIRRETGDAQEIDPQPRWATALTATRKRYSQYVGTTRTAKELALKWWLRLERRVFPIVYGVSGLWRHSRSAHLGKRLTLLS